MSIEAINVRVGPEERNPDQDPWLEGAFPPVPGYPRHFAGETEEPLARRIAKVLKAGYSPLSPAEWLRRAPGNRSHLKGGD